MKNKKYTLLAFACGLLILIIQFLMFAFQFINGDTTDAVFVVYYGDEAGLGSFLSVYWWSLVGTLLLTGIFVRRITKGPEAMLTFAGVLLWVVQILSLHESEAIMSFILSNFIGIVGIVLVCIAAIYDAYLIKIGNSDGDDNRE